MTADEQIPQAIAAIRANDHSKARELLEQVIDKDPDNDRAWQWLAIVVETVEEQSKCLHRALSLNPENRAAQQALKRLASPDDSVFPIPPTVALARPAPLALSEADQFLYYYDPPTHRLSSYVIALSLFAIAGFGFTLVILGSMMPWVRVAGVETSLEQDGFKTLIAGVFGLLAAALAIWRSGCLTLLGSIAAVSCTLVSIIIAAYNVYYAASAPGANVHLGFVLIVVGGIVAIVSSVINSFSGLWMLIQAWSK